MEVQSLAPEHGAFVGVRVRIIGIAGLLLNVSPSTHVASMSERTTTLARRRRWRDIQVTYAESRVGPIPDAVEAGRASEVYEDDETTDELLWMLMVPVQNVAEKVRTLALSPA